MIVELLTEHHLGFLTFKGGCIGSYETTLVKMAYCWISHGATHFKRMNPVLQLGNLLQGCDSVDIVTKGNTLEHNCYIPKYGLEQE